MDLQTLSSNGAIVHKNKMFNFYIDQELVDTELILSDGSIKVHGIVLATESKPACKLLKSLPGPWRTLKWTQYSKEVMRLVIEYIYRGTVSYPRQLETQIKSLTKFLQLDGISIKKAHISSKFKIESFGTTDDLITNNKPEEVIEISDEECSLNTFISQSPTKSIPEEPIDKIQHLTNSLLCSPVPQNQDQCKSSNENVSDTTFYESSSENEIKSADKFESVHIESAESILTESKNEYISKIDFKPTEKSPVLFVLLEECIAQHDNTLLPQTSDTCLSIPPEENDPAIPEKPLEANNTSSSTFFSLTPNTCLSPQLKQSELLEKQIFSKDEYFTSHFDDSLPNLRSKKNPYAKMIKKNVTAKRKILNFLTEPNDEVLQDDVFAAEPPLPKEVEDISGHPQVDTTEESTRNATNQNIPSNISIISQHIITTPDQEDEDVSIRKDPLGNSNKEISHNLRESLDRSPPVTRKDSKNKYDQLSINIEQIPSQTSKKRKSVIFKTKIKRRRRSIGLNIKHCDEEKNNLKATKLSRKYCFLCDHVVNNFRIHLQYSHKEVFRNALSMCDKCYTPFYFEIFKNNHDCE